MARTSLPLALFLALAAAIVMAIPINHDPEMNPNLFEGDIMGVDPKDILAGHKPRNAVTDSTLLWPDGVMYYEVNEDDYTQAELDVIYNAFREYEEKTCLRLRPHTNQRSYVYIHQTGDGCYSYIGHVGIPRQPVSLDSNCLTPNRPATAMHELMHAFGFYHEQSRTDRDSFVTINYTNIQPGYEDNFLNYDETVIQDLGTSYDYDSMMHYGAYGFAIDPSIPTIITRNLAYQNTIGQRLKFSDTDLLKLNRLYKCPTVL